VQAATIAGIADQSTTARKTTLVFGTKVGEVGSIKGKTFANDFN
jgi:hypothetical protein